MVSSCRPIQRGVYWTTLVGVISTCVGNRSLPELRRLARNTSPDAKGRPFRQIQRPTITTSAATAPSPHRSQSGSPVTIPDVKLFLYAHPKEHSFAVSCPRFARPFPSKVALRQTDYV